MANKNFIVKNGLEVGGQEVVSSSGVVTSAALGGQTLASTDSPTFNNLTVSNDLGVSGDLNLTGDLNITGDVNSLSVTDLDVTDQTITLGAGQVESASGGSGIVVDGSGASILWDETNDEWDFNKSITVTGRTLVSDDQTNDWIKQEVSASTSTISLGNTESTGGTAQWSYSRSVGALSGNIGAAAGTNFMFVKPNANIGFGTDDPDGKVHIFKSSAGTVTATTDANTLILESSTNAGMTFLTGNTSVSRIRFGDTDSNTRGNIFYNHSNDSLGFQTAASTAITIDSSQNVGIGPSSPNANLHIGSASATGDATNPALQIGGATTYRLGMYTTAEGGVIDNANGDDGLQFHTKNAGEAVRITADGNLQMIGQTSSFASPGFTYHTNNYLYCRGGSAGLILSDDSGINTVQIIDGSAGYINFETGDGSSRMRINSSRIEIDPTNDRYKFTYDGTSFNEGLRMAPHSNDYSVLVLGAGTGDSGSVDGQWTIARYPDADNNKFAIRHQSDTNAFTILKTGNVGIGADVPENLLHAKGTNNSAGDLGTAVGPGNIPALHVQNAGTTDNNMAAIFFMDDASVRAGVHARFTSHSSDDAELRLSTSAGGNLRERMVIDKDGNVGIGETNPTKLGLTGSSTGKVLALGGDDCQLRLTYTVLHHDHTGNTTTHLRNHYGSLDALARMKLESGYISFHTGTAFTEGMRVDAGGRLLINQTSSNLTYGKLQVSAGGETAGHGGIVGFFDTDVSVGSSNLIQRLMFTGDPDATGGVFIRFSDSNSTLGQITAANGTQCSYGVSSDERLKENIVDASSQLDLINNIRVREFDWKVNGYHEVGMIAQELNTVVPSVVQEGGDDITEEPWSVDYGKLTPYLIKAVQEQQTIIENLQSRLDEAGL